MAICEGVSNTIDDYCSRSADRELKRFDRIFEERVEVEAGIQGFIYLRKERRKQFYNFSLRRGWFPDIGTVPTKTPKSDKSTDKWMEFEREKNGR